MIRSAALGSAVLAAPARGQTATAAGAPFGPDTVAALARGMAAKPYVEPDTRLPSKLLDIDYAVYAGVTFQASKALWRAEGLPFQVQFFPRGYLYRPRIDIFEVIDGRARPVAYSPDLFDRGRLDAASFPPDLGFSGFRIHAPINSPGQFEEFAVFQGASYFRAVAKGQVYGLSGRGLALGSGHPHEEFPWFRAFWLERPARDADALVVHALLDSPSVTGAYRFSIRPGEATIFDIEAALYPRREIANAGVAPMSSMFYMGEIDHYRRQDARAAVHDSQGLEIWNGRGERLWRPLENPRVIETDAFQDRDPHGWGLMQRRRRPEDYRDPQSYERRPSAWIEPRQGWGAGAVELLEITTTDANADNIAAFWTPREPWRAGSPHAFGYRLTWGWNGPAEPRLARVTATRRSGPDGLGFQITFQPPPGVALDPAALRVEASASAGALKGARVEPAAPEPGAPAGQAVSLSFDLDPGAAAVSELRAVLAGAHGDASETWLYRWTR